MPIGLHHVRQAVARPPEHQDLPEGGRRAAVAAVLSGDLELLFMKRAEHDGDPWSGHVSFPGGRVERGETVLQAARRETLEEVGLDLTSAELLGELDEVRTVGPLPPILIRPYLFWLPELPRLRLNHEVASVHTLSLRALLADRGRGRMTHPWRDTELTFPRVDFDGVRLWGLTLHMVDDLLDRLDGRGRGLGRLDAPADTPWDAPA